MASTTFSFEDDDSGSEHEHWPEDFKPTPAVAATGYDTHNGLRMRSYQPATVPSTKAASPSPSLSPPPSPEKSIKATVLTEIPVQYAYPAPEPVKMATHTHAYVSAPAPATVAPAAVAPSAKTAAPKVSEPVPNTFVYQPTFSEKPAEAANKWQGRTKAEVEEDNTKIAADEKVWEKRKVVPTGLADDQMCWVVETDAGYTLR